MRAFVFAKRNFKEILRDPISYIFGLGLPIVMLAVMSFIDSKIPSEAGMTIFRIENLSCGVAVFSLTFTMLCAALLVSKDRRGAFIKRLYTTPMRADEFIVGYMIPLLCFALAQMAVTFLCSLVISAIRNGELSAIKAVFAFLSLLPSAVLFVSLGVALGFLLSDKSSPPVCSAIISVSGIIGGIWFDCASIGGGFEIVCRVFPFYNSVLAARSAAALAFEVVPFLITVGYMIVMFGLAILSFFASRKK